MTAGTFAAVALAGALGACARALLDGAITTRVAGRVAGRQGTAWGTAVVNLAGSLAAGAVAGLGARAALPPEVQLVAATGFLGAFTTFSTWMVHTAVLVRERRLAASALSLASLVGGALAALAGMAAVR